MAGGFTKYENMGACCTGGTRICPDYTCDDLLCATHEFAGNGRCRGKATGHCDRENPPDDGDCSHGTDGNRNGCAAGPIAFIALAAPQLVRRLTRSPDVPVVSGALMGAVLLLGSDLLSQNSPLYLKMPIGLTTGLLGGIYLLWLLSRERRI